MKYTENSKGREAEDITERDVEAIVSDENRIQRRVSDLDRKKYRKFILQVKLALKLIGDYRKGRYTDIPWRTIALLSAAILYFINPFDVVPDILPVLGFTDDAVLFAAVFKSIQSDLQKYGEWKGINSSEYF